MYWLGLYFGRLVTQLQSELRIRRLEVPGWSRAQVTSSEISGSREGPVVSVVAGLGGTAYAGVESCWNLISRLRAKKITGTVRVIPIADVAGFLDRSAYFCTLDDRPLVRAFERVGRTSQVSVANPLATDQDATAAIASAIVNLIEPSDFHIELRGGELTESHVHWVAAPSTIDGKDSLAERAANASGAGFRVCLDGFENPPFALGSAGAAARLGVPALILSTGGAPFELQQDAEVLDQGLKGILGALGVISGGDAAETGRLREVGPRSWTHTAQQSGLWIANVKTGQRVEKGQILGEIWDCFGTILEEVVSRVDGWVLSVTTSMAVGAQARDDGDDWFRRTVTIAENRASPDVRPTAALL